MKFVVEGEMRISGERRKFVKEVDAPSKERATEISLKRIGADHKLKRTQIKIDSVEEWKE